MCTSNPSGSSLENSLISALNSSLECWNSSCRTGMRSTAWICRGRFQLWHFSIKRTKGFQWFGAPAFQILPWSCRGTLGWLNSFCSSPWKNPRFNTNPRFQHHLLPPRALPPSVAKRKRKKGITFLCFLERCPFKAELAEDLGQIIPAETKMGELQNIHQEIPEDLMVQFLLLSAVLPAHVPPVPAAPTHIWGIGEVSSRKNPYPGCPGGNSRPLLPHPQEVLVVTWPQRGS